MNISTGLTHLSYKGFSENWSFEFVPVVPIRLRDKWQRNADRVSSYGTLILCCNVTMVEIAACIVCKETKKLAGRVWLRAVYYYFVLIWSFSKGDWCYPSSFSPTERRGAGLLSNINEAIDEKFDRWAAGLLVSSQFVPGMWCVMSLGTFDRLRYRMFSPGKNKGNRLLCTKE